MGIIEDYLNEAITSPSASPKAGGLVKQYLAAETDNKSKRTIPNVPISPSTNVTYSTPEEVAAVNEATRKATNNYQNPRSQESYVGRAGGAAYDAAKAGILEAGTGLSEALSGKPASGLGKIGMGGLAIVGSPLAAAGQFAGDVTGNKDLANKTELLSGAALPVKSFNKFSPVSVPTFSAPNPLTKVARKEALDELVSKITSNGREPENLVRTIQEMKANSRIGPADTSPAVLNMTQKLFTTEGDAAKNYLSNTSKSRVATSKDTINAAYDEAAGLPVNAVAKLKELKQAAEKVGTEQINPAVKGSGAVDISNVVNHIDDILTPGVMKKITGESTLAFPKVKQAVENVKSMIATDTERLTSPQALHDFQTALRREAEARIHSTDGEQRQLGYALMAIRNKVVEAIDIASPKIKNAEGKEIGSYKPALNNYREEKHIDEAFHDAYNGILSSSKKLENRPEFTKEWFDSLTKLEKDAAIQGIRTRIDTEIGVAHNPANAGTKLGKSDFNQKKMEAVLGKEETEKLLQKLEHERAISNTHNKIVEGSQTEMRRAGDQAISLPEKKDISPINKYALPIAATATEAMVGGGTGMGALAMLGLGGAAKLGSMASHKVKTELAKERNYELAKMSLPGEGPSRDQLIKDLESHLPKAKLSILNKARLALPIRP